MYLQIKLLTTATVNMHRLVDRVVLGDKLIHVIIE